MSESNPVSALKPESVTLLCSDGERLKGHFFAPAKQIKALPVLVAPATGVRQQFYWRFADWLAQQGYAVFVFDYRGIGLSLEGRLSSSKARLIEWGQLDQVAALEWLLARTGMQQATLIGHSAGAQMIGLLPNHERIARLVGVAASTGWFGGMRPTFALKARLGLGILLPLTMRLKGYAATSWIGLGENLPTGVARQWFEWCSAGGYATNGVRGNAEADFHAQVRTPITVLHAADDDIATTTTVHDLLRTFPGAPRASLQLKPADHGLRGIGHLDWFRQSHRVLWPMLLQAMQGELKDAIAFA